MFCLEFFIFQLSTFLEPSLSEHERVRNTDTHAKNLPPPQEQRIPSTPLYPGNTPIPDHELLKSDANLNIEAELWTDDGRARPEYCLDVGETPPSQFLPGEKPSLLTYLLGGVWLGSQGMVFLHEFRRASC